MTERIGLDNLPRVTADEALEHCIHHLQLAAVYFMNVGEDLEGNLAEAKRIVLRDNPHFEDDPKWLGVKAFLVTSHEAHDKAKREWDEKFPERKPGKPDETVRSYIADKINHRIITCPICGGNGRHRFDCTYHPRGLG